MRVKCLSPLIVDTLNNFYREKPSVAVIHNDIFHIEAHVLFSTIIILVYLVPIHIFYILLYYFKMNIDNVLVFLGMGRYQFTGYALFGLLKMYSNWSPVTYIFTASDLKFSYAKNINNYSRLIKNFWILFLFGYRLLLYIIQKKIA